MIRRRPTWWLACLFALALARPAAAQSADVLLAEGIKAYDALEFSVAAHLFRRALDPEAEGFLDPAARARARMHLGAAELLRGDRNAAIRVFRRLVIEDPRYRPDELRFPPRVTDVYDQARRTTKAVAAEVPDRRIFDAGRGAWRASLAASSRHEIVVDIVDAGGRRVQSLYRGPIDDVLTVSWNGLAADGTPPSGGQYRLVVESRSGADVLRAVQVPLRISAGRLDTLRLPPPPDSALLPERRSALPGLKFLLPAVTTGALLIGTAISDETNNDTPRFIVGAAVSVGALA